MLFRSHVLRRAADAPVPLHHAAGHAPLPRPPPARASYHQDEGRALSHCTCMHGQHHRGPCITPPSRGRTRVHSHRRLHLASHMRRRHEEAARGGSVTSLRCAPLHLRAVARVMERERATNAAPHCARNKLARLERAQLEVCYGRRLRFPVRSGSARLLARRPMYSCRQRHETSQALHRTVCCG